MLSRCSWLGVPIFSITLLLAQRYRTNGGKQVGKAAMKTVLSFLHRHWKNYFASPPYSRFREAYKVTRRVDIVRFASLIWPKENDSPFVIVQHRSCQFTSSSESSQIDLHKTLASFLIRIIVGQYFRDTLGAIHCISVVFSYSRSELAADN